MNNKRLLVDKSVKNGTFNGRLGWSFILLFVTVFAFASSCPSYCTCTLKLGRHTVDCSNKRLRDLPQHIPSKTQVFDISENKFTHFFPGQYFVNAGLIHLRTISLARCEIAHIDALAFQGILNLESLDISYNMLYYMPSRALSFCRQLRELRLSRNPIPFLENDTFTALQHLQILDVSHCEIYRIEKDTFKSLTSLQQLKLNGNRLRTLSGLASFTETLQVIHWDRNPWDCDDCSLLELRLWLLERNVGTPVEPMCANLYGSFKYTLKYALENGNSCDILMPLSTTTESSKPGKETVPGSHDTGKIILAAAAVSTVTVFVLGALIFFLFHRHYQQKLLSNTELNEFFNGARRPHDALPDKDANAVIYKFSYDQSQFEIDCKSFSVDHSKILGSGEFGVVCAGKVARPDADFIDVAVKMVNAGKQHKTALRGLLSEIKVLSYLGKHENVIKLIGASTRDLKNGKVFVFLEFGQNGSLDKHLRKCCPSQNDGLIVLETEKNEMELHEYANTSVGNTPSLDPSLSNDLHRWSKEICNGMSFLASKHVVHADLATRNILLNAEKTAKICDFGLSRRMYNYTNYVKQHQEPLPWKWMSPEALKRNEFSEKSDVWAYGIAIWEIYSLGDMPYQGLSWDPNFSQMLERGFRLSQPKYSDNNMYTIMRECWNTNPIYRPGFADLLTRFDDTS